MLKECYIRTPAFIQGDGVERFNNRCKDLIMYLQAYDFLMAAQRLSQEAAGYSCYAIDANDLDAIRWRLQHFARNVYMKSNSLEAFVRHNNVSLIAAGTLGLAAVVLHDCGYNRASHNWHPAQWADAARWNIEKTLFDAHDALSKRGGEFGYAEGPHYFEYAFEHLLPFFRAYRNFMPTVASRVVKYRGWREKFTVEDYFTISQPSLPKPGQSVAGTRRQYEPHLHLNHKPT